MAPSSARIVICGAGIAGVSAAYHLAVVHGCRNVTLIEADAPLSMTSDKSTEAYRNWWPGPDPSITAYMNRSIDILEDIARNTGNRINMNRRGYVFASGDATKIEWLAGMAATAERHGAGPVRVHETPGSAYQPSPEPGFDPSLDGVDLITDRDLIRRHFPYLTPDTRVVAHARRAGWLSAQQLGMVMLEAARAHGVQLVRGRLTDIGTEGGRVRHVVVEQAGRLEKIAATHLVLSAGPLLKSVAALAGIDLPIFAERHYKISFSDTLGIMPRDAPMLIWLDPQRLPWSDEERGILASDPSTRWLTEPFPWGAHGRPDGGPAGTTVLALFNYENAPAEVVFPLPDYEHYGEITLRGMSTMIPGLKAYVDTGIRPYIDGGYYMKTRENRPLVGPTPVEGIYVSGAYSGYGIMAACAGGDLLARHVVGADLPAYAPAFLLTRYDDPAYRAMLDTWGDGGQL
jgi:glycine/D-amino acid oxidase-like deaminating enzyme